jgi:hypothetical protein
VEEEDQDQRVKQEQQQKQHHDEEDDEWEERRTWLVELPRLRIPELMVLGMSHIPPEDDNEPHCQSSPIPSAVLQLLK